MKRNRINAIALLVILMGISSFGFAQHAAASRMLAECTSGDGGANCKCEGACWGDSDSCGCY